MSYLTKKPYQFFRILELIVINEIQWKKHQYNEMKKNLSKQYSSYQISLTKKSFNCFGMNSFTLEYQPNTFTTT